jgi:hypothetical protein
MGTRKKESRKQGKSTMCTTSKRAQVANPSQKKQLGIQPNASAGQVPVATNAFLGKPERIPQIAYIREKVEDRFLTSAKNYYQFFGINVHDINSIDEMIQHLSRQNGNVFERLLLVSHAHPRGMIIPMFTDGVKGTNKEAFQALANSDLDGLKLFAPFDEVHKHVFNWGNVMPQCLKAARNHKASALEPFGLQASGNPSGELLNFFKYCFDVVFTRQPGLVKRNVSQEDELTEEQRTTLINFIDEILVQLGRRLVSNSIGTAGQIQILRDALTTIPYNDLKLTENSSFVLGLFDDSMNDFPTLKAMVAAIRGGFRDRLNKARERVNENTILDIRGCRAGEDPEYVESLRIFFGRTAHLPRVTAPRLFQSYPMLAWKLLNDRAEITRWIGTSQWGHSSVELKAKFSAWADLIRVRPLHTEFFQTLLRGRAIRFAALGWRSEIPSLFIPTPGLTALNELTLAQVILKLKEYFNVPAATLPSTSTLSSLQTLIQALPTYNKSLLATISDFTPEQLQQLYVNLRNINTTLGQSTVPTTQPAPLTAILIQQYQQGLIDYLENTPLAPIKKFMTAAANSFSTGNGLYYYMLLVGLPVYVFGRPKLEKNGLVMLTTYQDLALKAWYKCLWVDSLPTTGAYTTARLKQDAARHAPALIAEDRQSILSICPLPRYNNCIRKRPLPNGENELDCSNSNIP